MIRSYNELRTIDNFVDRFEYLKLRGGVGNPTFGFERYLNQVLYHSSPWKRVRDLVIVRDNACDLGVDGHDIYDLIVVHHINPITVNDIEYGYDCVYDLNNLICTSDNTHKAIHYSDVSKLVMLPKARTKSDTKLWQKGVLVEDSILTSIKKPLNIGPEDTSFDSDIIMFINSTFLSLSQLGFTSSFMISSTEDTWDDFLGDRADLAAVQTYIYLKVKLLFDPPQNSFLVDSIKNQITELEWRLNIQVEGGA